MNRRLYRSRTDTVLGGVASGLAVYLNTDPALVRIAWAILVPLTGGAAFLAYIVGWIVVPEEPYPGAATGAPPPGPAGAGAGASASEADAGEGEADASDPIAESAATPATWTSPPAGARRGDNRAGILVGIGLVIIGLWFLVRPYLPDIQWNLIWPVLIVAIGGLILVTAARRSG
ncbi:MAG TPA: PspC domain-containing protein [Candidatus Limnocylindria bacterium]|nr:PspC domain-containing protein [Candidatus Limnocylindria bacterium]